MDKRAEVTIFSLETLGKVVLTVIVLIGLWGVFAQFIGMFNSDKEQATLRNFETLVATLTDMEEDATLTNYPIYIEDGFVILGYWTNSNAIGGICPTIKVTEQQYNTKPTACGLGNTGCLCLCEENSDFEKICHEDTEAMVCKNADDFGKDLSFEGNMINCDFALIKGNKNIQIINMTNNDNRIVISS
jgi:hypothetical protein